MTKDNVQLPNLIAFCGYARSGKDAAAQAFINIGYKRHAFGDIVKKQLDPFIKTHFGFSAFTENDAEKRKIRSILEAWGHDNGEAILKEYFDSLSEKSVSPRVMHMEEAEGIKKRGGLLIYIQRPYVGPVSPFEGECIQRLRFYIDFQIYNDGTEADLQRTVLEETKIFLCKS